MTPTKITLALNKLAEIKTMLHTKLAAEAGAGGSPAPAPTVETVTAKDGAVYRIEGEMAVGAKIFLVDITGETPAPDGDVELETGEILTIKDGAVEALTESPAGADPAMTQAEQDAKVAAAMRAHLAEIDPTGTSTDPRDLMLKALMEAQFGWQIRETEQKANNEAAIAAYKATLSDLTKTNEDLVSQLDELKALRKTENEAILQAFDIQAAAIKEIATAPNGGEPNVDGRIFTKRQTTGGPLSRLASN